MITKGQLERLWRFLLALPNPGGAVHALHLIAEIEGRPSWDTGCRAR